MAVPKKSQSTSAGKSGIPPVIASFPAVSCVLQLVVVATEAAQAAIVELQFVVPV
jgi:hypothetical protein